MVVMNKLPFRQKFRKSGTNAAAIVKGASVAVRWPSRLRVRMTEAEMHRYGGCNTLRIVNKSALRARIHFTWGISNEKYEDVEANSIRNITVEDGYIFYGFDVENLDTGTDIAIGEIQYIMTRVEAR